MLHAPPATGVRAADRPQFAIQLRFASAATRSSTSKRPIREQFPAVEQCTHKTVPDSFKYRFTHALASR